MHNRLRTKTTATLLCMSAAVSMNIFSSTSAQDVLVAGITLSDLHDAGYRIDWINKTSTGNLRLPTVIGNSFYTIDEDDNLSRYNAATGEWVWSNPIGNKIFEMLSISEFPDSDLVYVLSDGAVYLTYTLTGTSFAHSQEPKSNISIKPFYSLRLTANTSAMTTDNTLLYGTITGDLVWLEPKTGYVNARYHVGNAISSTPILVSAAENSSISNKSLVIGTSSDGTVIAIDSRNISRTWGFKLTAPVIASVSYDTNSTLLENEKLPRSTVVIAGQDQYLRAVDLHTGKPRWKALTTSPLENSPAIYGGVLYQRIPSEGLACYETFPNDYSGKLKWTAEDVKGNVITTTSNKRLVCWDENNKKLQILDPYLGAVTATVTLPSAKQVVASNTENGALFILTEDDEIIRLALR